VERKQLERDALCASYRRFLGNAFPFATWGELVQHMRFVLSAVLFLNLVRLRDLEGTCVARAFCVFVIFTTTGAVFCGIVVRLRDLVGIARVPRVCGGYHPCTGYWTGDRICGVLSATHDHTVDRFPFVLFAGFENKKAFTTKVGRSLPEDVAIPVEHPEEGAIFWKAHLPGIGDAQ